MLELRPGGPGPLPANRRQARILLSLFRAAPGRNEWSFERWLRRAGALLAVASDLIPPRYANHVEGTSSEIPSINVAFERSKPEGLHNGRFCYPEAGYLLGMPAWRPGQRIRVKLVSVFHGNQRVGLPGHLVLICLFDPGTGAPWRSWTVPTSRPSARPGRQPSRCACSLGRLVMAHRGPCGPEQLIATDLLGRPAENIGERGNQQADLNKRPNPRHGLIRVAEVASSLYAPRLPEEVAP